MDKSLRCWLYLREVHNKTPASKQSLFFFFSVTVLWLGEIIHNLFTIYFITGGSHCMERGEMQKQEWFRCLENIVYYLWKGHFYFCISMWLQNYLTGVEKVISRDSLNLYWRQEAMKVSERKGAFLHHFLYSDSILHIKRWFKAEIVAIGINISNKHHLQ